MKELEEQISEDKKSVHNGRRRAREPLIFKAEVEHLLKHNTVAKSRIEHCGDSKDPNAQELVQNLMQIDQELKMQEELL